MNKDNPLFLSLLVSGETSEITREDITNLFNQDVSSHLKKLYLIVIKNLIGKKSYDEILEIIDEYNDFGHDDLLLEQKVYIKNKVKSDVIKRRKNKGEMINE